MRGKDLYEKITNIDDDIISDVGNMAKSRKPLYRKRLAVAACFVLVISVLSLLNRDDTTRDPNLDLPMLTINTEFAGMGFEGYMAYDISELTNANPWNEDMNITHLPVIENKFAYDEIQHVEAPDYKRMEKLLVETAEDIGMDAKNIPITNDVPDKETQKDITDKLGGTVPDGYFDATRFFMEDEKYIVEVDTSNTARVDFKVPVELPKEYNFTYDATYEETYKVAEYLKDEYAAFIGMKDPVINVFGGDFNIYGEQFYRIALYGKSSDQVQNILNYHFNTVEFYCNDDGALFLARKYETDLSEVVGVYPIVDGEKALVLLEAGNYITSVPQEFAGKEHVKKMELVYRLSRTDKLFMPYYKFYVELPDMKRENGLNSYGAYYVPAVEEQYIENMPVWDGSFN